jgi:hypothetical protein
MELNRQATAIAAAVSPLPSPGVAGRKSAKLARAKKLIAGGHVRTRKAA